MEQEQGKAIKAIQELGEKLKAITTTEANQFTKGVLTIFLTRMADTEQRMVRSYNDYTSAQKTFQNDIQDSNYSGELISEHGRSYSRHTEFFVQDIVQFIDIVGEEIIKIFESIENVDMQKKIDGAVEGIDDTVEEVDEAQEADDMQRKVDDLVKEVVEEAPTQTFDDLLNEDEPK